MREKYTSTIQKGPMWFFPGFEIRPGRKVMWSKVLQVLWTRGSKSYDVIKLEMESMQAYKVFKKWDKAILDKHKKVKNPPKGYHRIKVHLVFAVKFDGRQ